MTIVTANFASTTFPVAITNVATTLSVAAGTGALFPALSAGQYFYAVLQDSLANVEIVQVTARSGDTMTIARAQEGTTAKAFTGGSLIELRPTAATIDELAGTRSGNLTFTGTGNRITGDFSNATPANKVVFKTSTVNGATAITAMPDGTGTQSQWIALNGSDPNNASGIQIKANATEAVLQGYNVGTGGALPMTFWVSGGEAYRVDTTRNLIIGSTTATTLDAVGSGRPLVVAKADSGTTITGSLANIVISNTDTTVGTSSQLSFATGTGGGNLNHFVGATISAQWNTARVSGQYSPADMVFATSLITNQAPTERLRIYSNGSILHSTSVNSGLLSTISNLNAGSSAYAKYVVTADSGAVWLAKVSVAGGSRGEFMSAGGVLNVGTSDAQTVNVVTGSTPRFSVDSSGNTLNVSTGGLGYGTGSGGTVTQATSKSTAVTLNKTNGQITMNGAALAANTAVQFTFSNSTVAATDTVILNIKDGTTTAVTNYNVWCTVGSGACAVAIKNISAGSLSEALVLNFAVIKAVTA